MQVLSVSTSDGVFDGLFGLLDSKSEALDLWPQLISPVVKHKGILELAHLVEYVCFLKETLQAITLMKTNCSNYDATLSPSAPSQDPPSSPITIVAPFQILVCHLKL